MKLKPGQAVEVLVNRTNKYEWIPGTVRIVHNVNAVVQKQDGRLEWFVDSKIRPRGNSTLQAGPV